MEPTLQLALNDALSQRARLGFRRIEDVLPGMAADSKRPKAWAEYGYPECPTFDDFYRLYERHGVAHGAINRLTEKCWETDPWIIEGEKKDDKKAETAWERELKRVFKAARVWPTLFEADKRRLVGKFGAVLLQLRDGGAWQDPVTATAPALVKLIPAWESSLSPDTTDDDPNSETYGDVITWSFSEGGDNGRQLTVHRDRILILGDYRDGVPFLRAGYNSFVDLEKIQGGSGEGYLKNAARQLHVGFEKDVDLRSIASAHGIALSELQSVYDEVTKGMNQGIDSTIITQGANVSALSVAMADPSPHYSIALQTACASVRIPSRIIVGNQSGERSSTEDRADFAARAQGRRLKVLSHDIENLVRKLADIKVLKPIADFSVIWDDLREASQAEKLESAVKMADIVQKMAGSGDQVPFTSADIRDTAGFDNDVSLPVLPDTDPIDPEIE